MITFLTHYQQYLSTFPRGGTPLQHAIRDAMQKMYGSYMREAASKYFLKMCTRISDFLGVSDIQAQSVYASIVDINILISSAQGAEGVGWNRIKLPIFLLIPPPDRSGTEVKVRSPFCSP